MALSNWIKTALLLIVFMVGWTQYVKYRTKLSYREELIEQAEKANEAARKAVEQAIKDVDNADDNTLIDLLTGGLRDPG